MRVTKDESPGIKPMESYLVTVLLYYCRKHTQNSTKPDLENVFLKADYEIMPKRISNWLRSGLDLT